MEVYVGTYAKYNAGNLFGKWLDLTGFSDAEEFSDACRALHSDELDPEFMFQDWEGIPNCWVSESHLDPVVWEFLDDVLYVDLDQDAALAYVEWAGTWDRQAFEDCYCGQYELWMDYVYEFVDSSGYLDGVSESIRNYFDYEAFGRDLGVDYYHDASGFVFRNT